MFYDAKKTQWSIHLHCGHAFQLQLREQLNTGNHHILYYNIICNNKKNIYQALNTLTF